MVIAELKRGETPHQVVIEIVRRLERGEVLILPTDTVYGLHADARNEKAIKRICQLKGIKESRPFSAVYASELDIDRWVELPEGKESQMVFDGWPGAVTWVLPAKPAVPRHLLSVDGSLGIRIPSHPLLRMISTALNHLIVSTSANPHGENPVIKAEDLDQDMVSEVDGVVYELEPLQGNPSEVKKWSPAGPIVLRARLQEGNTEKERINVLFICTGNLCRSPMAAMAAAARMKKEAKGKFIFRSAGTMATPGQPASLPAIEAMKEQGVDLLKHQSRKVNTELMEWADIVLTMTTDHIGDLSGMFPELMDKVYLFSKYPEKDLDDQSGIADPYGLGTTVYRKTANQIMNQIDRIVPHLLDKIN